MINFLRLVFRSLFTRLAAVMFCAVIGINVITYSLYVGLEFGHETTINRSLMEYARSMANAIGVPPDIAVARQLAEERIMRITVDGSTSFVVGETQRRFPDRFLKPRFAVDGMEVSSLHGFYRVKVPVAPDVSITFDLFPTAEENAALHTYGIISLVGTCLIMFALYLAVRYLLRPVGWLTKGAAAVRDGELGSRVPEKSSGELRELSETFNQMAARLESLIDGHQKLLLGVSHELRTPLTRLKLRLAMLGEAVNIDPICKDIRQMETMIAILLDAARMRHDTMTLNLESVDMADLLSDAATLYGDSPPGVRFVSPGIPVVATVDRLRMEVLISNLIDNAIKYSARESAPVELLLSHTDEGVEFSVSDQGIGIPDDALEHLFEPFYRVDESRTPRTGGYGLGLYMCQAIAEAHGVVIKVESRLGVGTTMRVVIPG